MRAPHGADEDPTRKDPRLGGGGGIARTVAVSSAASFSSEGFDRDRLSARPPEGAPAAARLPAIRARPFHGDAATRRVENRLAPRMRAERSTVRRLYEHVVRMRRGAVHMPSRSEAGCPTQEVSN